MTPTNKLRWIGRVTTTYANGVEFHSDNKVLQQWWEDRNITLSIHVEDKDGNPLPSPNRGEWRDVPVEVEA
jgi:hypothetical protein